MKQHYKVLGIMSGTSLDGLDFCLVEFNQKGKQWNYKIVACETVAYTENWTKKLTAASATSSLELCQLDYEYGKLIGKEAFRFLNKHNEAADLIASHGHTVHHQPKKGFTLQIGHGGAIAAETKQLIVSDLRSQDVALGGEGAPLVPLGDHDLFSSYKACLNIGGITNVSYQKDSKRIACDIAPSNLILNKLSEVHFSKPFDKNGNLSREGSLDETLLAELNAWSYYKKTSPKSLGREDIFPDFYRKLGQSQKPPKDIMHTFCKHWGKQVSALLLKEEVNENVLITGGGAKNSFLLECLDPRINYFLPEVDLIDFKEALIFAYLGLKRSLNEINVLSSVTGATNDHSAGAIYKG